MSELPKHNKCAHPTCNELKPRSQYACPHHWSNLPFAIRDKILRGYKNSRVLWSEGHIAAQKYWLTLIGGMDLVTRDAANDRASEMKGSNGSTN